MTCYTRLQTRHLPPDIQEFVGTIIDVVLALATRVNSNSDSNLPGGTNSVFAQNFPFSFS